ncbi:MAG: transcriptional repressor LexA, partial [Candidatus Woesebacteria bacterium]|nr:transcriptional repressor LexA [Candidatus Woesebacteria bacterium]
MITPKQKQILEYYKKHFQKNGFFPSLQEAGDHFGLVKSNIHKHLKNLENKGYLEKINHKARGVNILKKEQFVKIPLLGIIAAGEPIEAIQTTETIAVPKNKLPKNSEVYALKVEGDSMVDENIHNGDTILVKKQNYAQNGDKVVAILNENEATLKTFYKEKGQVRLQPANKNYQPIIIKNDQQLALQGVLIDVIKINETKEQTQTFVLPSKKDSKERRDTSNYLNRVYNGDIMDVLKDLPDNSVDMVFGDPDYNVGIKYGNNNYTKNFNDYINWYIELTKES